MPSKRLPLFIAWTLVAALLVSAGSASAQGGQSLRAESLGPLVVLYEQMDSAAATGIQSQFMPDIPTLSNQGADDFVVAVAPGFHAWSVDTVEVIGAYNGTASVASVNVQFYADSGAGLPGALVYNTTVAPAQIANMATGDFVLTLLSPAALAPGTNWVSVQPNKNLSTGQWFWTERTAASNSASAWREPNSQGACRNWAPRLATCGVGSHPDLIFRLNGTHVATVAKVYLPAISR